ncbi:MAG: dual specificity protein phosphatase family protein [Candidatus Nanopelagicales bacterium]
MDYSGYGDIRQIAAHPHDSGVILAGVGHLDPLPEGVDSVVSLCRLGRDQVPAAGIAPEDHVEVWLVDSSAPDDNPNLDFVLSDTADLVEQLRNEGRTVLLHCVHAVSRTPTVAAMYAIHKQAVSAESALSGIRDDLPLSDPNRSFLDALVRHHLS